MSEFINISDCGIKCRILTYGACLVSFEKDGFDCVLGYDTADGYKNGDCYFGAVIGRVCNRTAGGIIDINGRHYTVSKNDGENSLHGGFNGFDKKEWSVQKVTRSSVLLTLLSNDGDEGYPAEVRASAEYSIHGGALHLHLHAESTAETPVCMTGHSYFNLGGDDVREYGYMINSGVYCARDAHGISCLPTDALGTDHDFRRRRKPSADCDHHFIFDKSGCFADAVGERAMLRMSTDMPGMQFYDGNAITENTAMKNGTKTKKYCGFCFEPQYIPSFSSVGAPLCTPSKPFDSHITYCLTVF